MPSGTDQWGRAATLSPDMAGRCYRAPLSPGQRRLWFIDRFAPNSSVYNEPLLIVRIRGALSVSALSQAIDAMVRRHEILRTTIAVGVEGPYQQIHQATAVSIKSVDLTGERAEAQMWAIARREAGRTFDLARGPLMRVLLARLSPQHHVMLVAMHHIVSDAWSLRIFLPEIMALYDASEVARASPLPRLPAQYADYARWAEQALSGAARERLTEYWTARLRPSPPRIVLPYGSARPSVQRFAGSVEGVVLDKQCVATLQRLARQHACTLFMILLTSFLTLLHRIGGSNTMTVGTAVANRTKSEWEPLIGFFANVVVLKVDLSGNPQFAQLLTKIRQVVLDAFEHQELPFDLLVEAMRPEREVNRQPLFDVMYVHHNFPVRKYQTGHLDFERIYLEEKDAKFDLVLLTAEIEDGLLAAQLIYDVDLFERSTIRRMLRALHTLLQDVERVAGQRLNRIELEEAATADERQFLERLCRVSRI